METSKRPGRRKATRLKKTTRKKARRKGQRPVERRIRPREPGAREILLGFRIENGYVYLINEEDDSISLFPANRLDRHNLNSSLRNAVATLMQDED